MSNKKIIDKILLENYKYNQYLIIGYGRKIGIRHQIIQIEEEYLNSLKKFSKADYKREYCNNPIISNDMADSFRMYIETFPLAFPK